jgi:dTDP-glucose 4,6-dehydratase
MNDAYDGIDAGDLDEAFARCKSAVADMQGGRIFLTGGTGFFGRWLLALLARAQREFDIGVTVLTRDPEKFRNRCPDLAAQQFIKLIRGDVRAFEFPEGRFSHIIHAATDTSAAADADATTLMESIIDGAKRVLEFAATAGVRRFLYVSSGAVYGVQPMDVELLPEDYRGACDPLDPRSAYGQAKRMAEQICACAPARGGPEIVIARAFAFVGPGLPLDAHFAIGNFIRDAVAERDIVISGDGSPLRSYLYAGDLAAWLFTLLARGEAGTAYNVGSDKTISIASLAHTVAALSSQEGRVTIMGEDNGGPRSRYAPSIDRARGLGLDVWTPLEESIRRTMGHARRQAAASQTSN